MEKTFKESFISAVSQIELQQLKYFVTVANKLSFSRAADELYVTQPLLSQKISSLEKILDTQLIERNTKSVKLTPYGEYFLTQAKKILNKVDEMTSQIRAVTTEEAKLEKMELACDLLIERTVLSESLHSLTSVYNELDVTVRKMSFPDIVQAVKQKNVGIGLTFFNDMDNAYIEGMNYKVIGHDEFVLLMHKGNTPVWDTEDLLRQLYKKPVMVPNRDSRMLSIVKSFNKQLGLLNVPVFYNDVEDLYLSVETGTGYTIVPKRKYSYYINSNVISYPLGHLEGGLLNYAACWVGELSNSAEEYFINQF